MLGLFIDENTKSIVFDDIRFVLNNTNYRSKYSKSLNNERYLHRYIYSKYIDNNIDDYHIIHLDENKRNNLVCNLIKISKEQSYELQSKQRKKHKTDDELRKEIEKKKIWYVEVKKEINANRYLEGKTEEQKRIILQKRYNRTHKEEINKKMKEDIERKELHKKEEKENNKELIREQNRIRVRKYMKKYREEKMINKEYSDKYRKYKKEYNLKYRTLHKEEILNHQKERIRNDENYRIRRNLSKRLGKMVNGKLMKTMDLLGCSIEEFKKHLECKFQEGMTWKNYGLYGWHIDHVRPCASFDLTDIEQQKICFHYTNLQPLWAIDNIRKRDKWHG